MKNTLLTIFLTIICISAYSQSYNSLDELLEADYLPINRIVSVKNGENSADFKIEKGQGDNITSFSITASKKAVLIGDISLINLSFIGVKYGEGLSKAEMQSNWAILKSFVYNYSDTLNLTDDLHIWVEGDDALTVEKDLTIKGNKNTLYIHPRKKGFRGTRKVFRHTFGNINIDDLYLKGYSDRWLLETYEVTFKPSGDQDAVLLSGIQSSGFWNNLSTGDTIAFQVDDATPGDVFIVSAFNEASKTISFTSNFGTADNYTVSGQSYIGIRFEENANSSDIQTYGKSWNVQGNEASALYEELIFISSLNTDTTAAVLQDNYKEFTFNNCEFEGMDYNLRLSGTWLNVYSNNTKEQANAISNSWTGGLANKLSKVVKNQGVVYDCGTICEASIYSNGVVSTNAIFGGGYYLHPAFVPNFNGVLFKDNNTTSYRNFSSSGNDITGEGWIGSFENCIWQSNNFEPLLITSKSWPTQIINCTFNAPYDGGQTTIQLGNSTSMIGCTVDAPIYLGLNSEPSNLPNDRYFLNFEDCVFYQNARIDLSQWPSATESKATFTFNNLTFFPSNNNADFTIKYSTGNLLINDCFIDRMNEDANGTIYNSSTNLNAFIQLDEGASDSNPFGTVSINNLRTLKDFSSNDMPIIKGYDENSSTATTADISGYVFNINVVGESGFTQENLSSFINSSGGGGSYLVNSEYPADMDSTLVFNTTASDATVTCADCAFSASDVGKLIQINGAGRRIMDGDNRDYMDGDELITTIFSVTSATEIEVTDAPTVTVSNTTGYWGTDMSPIINQLITDGQKEIVFKAEGNGWIFGQRLDANQQNNSCILVNQDNVTIKGIGLPRLNWVSTNPNSYITTNLDDAAETANGVSDKTPFDIHLIYVDESDNFILDGVLGYNIGQDESRVDADQEGGNWSNTTYNADQELNNTVVPYARWENKQANSGAVVRYRGYCVGGEVRNNTSYRTGFFVRVDKGATDNDVSYGLKIYNNRVNGYGSTAVSTGEQTYVYNNIFDNSDAAWINSDDRSNSGSDYDRFGTSHAIYAYSGHRSGHWYNNEFIEIKGTVLQWNTSSSINTEQSLYHIYGNSFYDCAEVVTALGNSRDKIYFRDNQIQDSKPFNINSNDAIVYMSGNVWRGYNSNILSDGTTNVETAFGLSLEAFDSLFIDGDKFYDFNLSTTAPAIRLGTNSATTGSSVLSITNCYFDKTNLVALDVTGTIAPKGNVKFSGNIVNCGIRILQNRTGLDARNVIVSNNEFSISSGDQSISIANPITFINNTIDKVNPFDIPVYADATARDAAIPSPTLGDYAYVVDVNQTQEYNGSAWVVSFVTQFYPMVPRVLETAAAKMNFVDNVFINSTYNRTYFSLNVGTLDEDALEFHGNTFLSQNMSKSINPFFTFWRGGLSLNNEALLGQVVSATDNKFIYPNDEAEYFAYGDDDGKLNFSSLQTSNFTVAIGEYNLVDPNGGAITATVPSGVTQVGTEFWVVDSEGTASGTNTITVDFSTNGYTVSGDNTAVINDAGDGFKFIYIGSNKWISERL